jgi:hypothetical protein
MFRHAVQFSESAHWRIVESPVFGCSQNRSINQPGLIPTPQKATRGPLPGTHRPAPVNRDARQDWPNYAALVLMTAGLLIFLSTRFAWKAGGYRQLLTRDGAR